MNDELLSIIERVGRRESANLKALYTLLKNPNLKPKTKVKEAIKLIEDINGKESHDE